MAIFFLYTLSYFKSFKEQNTEELSFRLQKFSISYTEVKLGSMTI